MDLHVSPNLRQDALAEIDLVPSAHLRSRRWRSTVDGRSRGVARDVQQERRGDRGQHRANLEAVESASVEAFWECVLHREICRVVFFWVVCILEWG